MSAVGSFFGEFSVISPSTQEAIRNYVDDHIAPGSFLIATLENNLMEAVTRADRGNLATLKEIVKFLYNNAPSNCWGSPAKVKAWLGKEF
jgi:hypothetical protein